MAMGYNDADLDTDVEYLCGYGMDKDTAIDFINNIIERVKGR